MSKQHLDLLAIPPRLRERFRLGESTGDISGFLVHIAYDPSRWHIRAALGLERTRSAFRHSGDRTSCVVRADRPCRCHRSTRRAGIDVADLVVDEVFPRERTIFPLRLVEDRHVWPHSLCRIPWHRNVGAMLNIPIEPWDTDRISNITFHRWASTRPARRPGSIQSRALRSLPPRASPSTGRTLRPITRPAPSSSSRLTGVGQNVRDAHDFCL